MLDALSDKLRGVFRGLSGRGRISEENVREALRDVRIALIDADVNFKVVREFTDAVQQKAIGQEVLQSLQPGELLVKIVHDELVSLMGPVDTRILYVQPPPTVIMMCGLQGSGKTTTCGKLARYLISKGHHPLLAAADLQRPAAVEQLRVLGQQADVPVYCDDSKVAPHGAVARGAAVSVCRAAINEARKTGRDVVILDTAGRLHIDDELMGELRDINTQLKPHQIFLVLDAMSGQDAVNSAQAFNSQLEIDGLILTKFDSDTRGGALLSAKVITGKPVKFIGVGEKLDALEEFHPERMAQRILGMGDILTLVETAQANFDADEAARLQAKMEKGVLTLEDFIAQIGQVRKLGPMGKVMEMIPGMGEMAKMAGGVNVESQMGRMQAMFQSMTVKERRNTDLIDANRRRRIGRGAGVQPSDVAQFIKQYEGTRDTMRNLGGMGMMGKMRLMKNIMSGNIAGIVGPGGPMAKTRKSGFMEKKDRNKKKRR